MYGNVCLAAERHRRQRSSSLDARCLRQPCSFTSSIRPDDAERGEEKTRHMYLAERKEATYENLRDLNFEYKAGKLSEEDYAMQRASLEDEAAAIMAEMEAIEARKKSVPSKGKP